MTLHSPTPRYLSATHSSTGTPMPYAYTSPTAVESRPKSYSRIAPDVLLGSDSHAAMEEAREEDRKRQKMRVVSVQKGP